MSENAELPIVRDKKTNLPLYATKRVLSLEYFIPVGKIEKFFEGLKNGLILATRCTKCGKIFFPPQTECPHCKTNTEWFELSGEAELVTYTIINVKPKTFEHYEDYIIAIGRLKEGINVLAWLKANKEDIKIGMKLKLVATKREPEGYWTYEFIPQ